MSRFEGKTVVVTGAASGIGKAAVERLTDDGATVVGADLVGGDSIRAVDVTDESAVSTLMDEAGDRLDGVVNAAGVAGGLGGVPATGDGGSELVADDGIGVRG